MELTFVDVDVYEYIVVAMNCSHNTFHILTIQVCIEPSDIQGCSETSKKKKKKKIPQRPRSVARELIPCRRFEPARVKPN